jgi:hypothetical protein
MRWLTLPKSECPGLPVILLLGVSFMILCGSTSEVYVLICRNKLNYITSQYSQFLFDNHLDTFDF